MQKREQIEWVLALLRAESTLTLATVDENGLPWSAPLFYLAEDDLTLYWLSAAKSQHSRNLATQPSAAVSIAHSVENWKEIRGVQMRGRVESIDGAAGRKPILERYCQRFHLGAFFQLAIQQSTLYAFHPEWIRGIDNTRHFGWKFELILPTREI